MKPLKVIVIGAGIVGVSSAIWLKRAGHDVTLMDRGTPGQGTSYGNGGILASCAFVPVTAPGLVRKAPKMLLDRDFPLFLRWAYLPRLAPWLMKYLSHANDSDTRRIAHALEPIVGDSVEQHLALAGGTDAGRWIAQSDYGFAYANRAAYEADAYTWALRKQAGFDPQEIEGAEVQDYEPSLSPDIGFVAAMKNHGFIRDPGGYVAHLAQILQGMGGTFVQAEVRDFDLAGDSIAAVETDAGRFTCDKAVLATGVWSKPIMRKLGLNVPLESERGYHIVFRNPGIQLRNPFMIASGKFVATPMAAGLRCAGVVEFGGLEAGPSKAPLALLRRQAKATFPGLNADSEEEWLGHRPAPADSLPLIGEVGQTGVIAAFGHHHIGLTGGPKTGRIVSELISGGQTNTDLSPYAPQRFA